MKKLTSSIVPLGIEAGHVVIPSREGVKEPVNPEWLKKVSKEAAMTV